MNIPIKYNVRSLFVRKGSTLMTVASIAFVVLVYIGVLSMAAGLKAAFGASGDPQNVIVLREGAHSETESSFEPERHKIIASLDGIALGTDGEPLASGEVLILQILEREDGSESNVSLRGVKPAAFALRPRLQIVEGRTFQPGVGEVIVGKRLSQRFSGLSLGSTIEFGRMNFKVVGIFESGGAFDSEVWGAVEDFGNAFRRSDSYSSTLVRAASRDEAEALIARIEGDQRLRMDAMTEPEYFREQTSATASQFIILGNALAILMAFGACFAAANTMYAQVSSRAKEVGTLRALGFRRRSVLGAFLLEAAVLGLLAGIAGALLSLPLNGLSAGTTNFVTFSEITFSLRTTPAEITGGIVLAVITGMIGGFPAALSASRREITALLRES